MKKVNFLIILFIIPAISLASAAIQDVEAEKAAIQEVVIEGYIKPAFVNGDIEAMTKAFHPQFNMLILRENILIQYPLKEWLKNIEKRGYPSKDVVTYNILNIDITGNAAVVKVEIVVPDKKYTDYLSLYKFKDGWKIVSKIYFQHN